MFRDAQQNSFRLHTAEQEILAPLSKAKTHVIDLFHCINLYIINGTIMLYDIATDQFSLCISVQTANAFPLDFFFLGKPALHLSSRYLARSTLVCIHRIPHRKCQICGDR